MRAILFDFNGVLLDDEVAHFELFRRVLGELDLELTEAEYYADYVGFDDEAGFRTALERAGRPAEPALLARLGARKASYYREWVIERDYPFFPGALRFVRSAAREGLELGIVSGALRAEIDAALTHAGVGHLFKVVVAAEDVERTKPAPDGYLLGLRQLNERPPLPARLLHPHEVLAIEDTPAGLEAARAAGLRTLGLCHTYTREELEAHHIADGFEDLSPDGLRGLFAA